MEAGDRDPKAVPSRPGRRGAALAAELLLLAAFLVLCHSVLNPKLYGSGRKLFPGPDGVEYGWFAFALNAGRSPMVAVAHEVHPSRYCPIHPLFVAAYMWLDGDGMDSFQQYSEVAMICACVFFWAMLAGLGARPPTRLTAVFLVFYSDLSIRLGRSLMPETTMALTFFAGGALAVWLARLRCDGSWVPRARIAGFFVAGALCAAAGTIRVSLVTLCALPVLAIWFGMQGTERRRCLLAVVAGCLATPLLTAVFNWLVMGYFGLAAYGHWTVGVKLLDPASSLNPSASFAHSPSLGRQYVDALTGRSVHLVWGGPVVMSILGGLALLSVVPLRRMPRGACETRWFPAFSLIVLAVNVAFHFVYFFFDMRFHLLQFALFVASATLGGQRVFEFLAASATPWVRATGRATCALGIFLVIDAPSMPAVTIHERTHARPPRWIPVEEMSLRNARAAGKVIRDFHVPVFTQGVPVGGARVLMRLENHLHVPFCPLFRVRDYQGDSHIVQFQWGTVEAAPRLLVTGEPWDSIRPHEAWLIDPMDGALNEEFARALIARHGAFIVYYPVAKHDQVVPLLEWSKAQGWPLTNLKPYQSYGLYLVGMPKG